jgi:hypothetical protein
MMLIASLVSLSSELASELFQPAISEYWVQILRTRDIVSWLKNLMNLPYSEEDHVSSVFEAESSLSDWDFIKDKSDLAIKK